MIRPCAWTAGQGWADTCRQPANSRWREAGAAGIFDPIERLTRVAEMLDIEIGKLNVDRTIQGG